jgi:hypothetical protein
MCQSGGSQDGMDAGSEIRDAGAPPIAGCPPIPGHLRVTVRYEYGAERPLLDQAEVNVSGADGGGGMQRTGPTGEVTFRDLAPGAYTVRVTHRCTTDGTASATVVSDTTTPVEVVVRPMGTLRGRVTDADNANPGTNGIQGARVSIEGEAGRTATTNAQGEFEFTFMQSGSYRVQATKAGHTRNTVPVTATFRPCDTANVTIPIRRITLEIVNRRTGAVVSGTNQSRIVGQKVELEVRTRPAGEAMTNIRWTIPGDRIKNYTQSVASAVKTDLAAADLQRATIDFYWINRGHHTVQVSAQVAGATLTASVDYNVLRPTINRFTTTVSSVNLCIGNYIRPGTWFAAYQPTPAPARVGNQWNAQVTAPAGGAGQIGLTQLINVNRVQTTNAAVTQTWSSGGALVLDDGLGIQYSGPQPIAAGSAATLSGANYADSPGNPLSAGYSASSATDSFELYLMYKSSEAGSIWVTLRKVRWNWAGQTTRIGAPASPANNWNAPIGTALASDANGTDSMALPTWNRAYSSLSWV